MVANAYILVNADPTHTGDVIRKLEAIAVILRHKIRPIKGVTNTVTCICF